MTVTIDVINDSADAGVPDAATMQDWSDATVRHLPPGRPSSVGVRIVDEAESAAINLAYRQKHYATNVLSFGTDLPQAVINELDEVPLGDLIICAPVVVREAAEQHKTLNAHWAHMLIHGILHLYGYDHEDEQDALEMESLEAGILLSLGFGHPYRTEQLAD